MGIFITSSLVAYIYLWIYDIWRHTLIALREKLILFPRTFCNKKPKNNPCASQCTSLHISVCKHKPFYQTKSTDNTPTDVFWAMSGLQWIRAESSRNLLVMFKPPILRSPEVKLGSAINRRLCRFLTIHTHYCLDDLNVHIVPYFYNIHVT